MVIKWLVLMLRNQKLNVMILTALSMVPETKCDDPNCPFHGTLSVRGQVLEGVVTTNKAERTITVERSFYKFIRKYERYEKRKSRINVHKPDCLDVEVGDSVKIAECRPLSKTKHFVLVEVKGDD